MKRLLTLFALLALVAAPAALAQDGPADRVGLDADRLTYSGLLTADDGAPVPDGTYTLTFRLHDSAAAAASWTETLDVVVTGGRFSTLLGAGTALPAGARAGYLSIAVGDSEPSEPMALSSSAAGGSLQTAYNAGNIINLGGGAAVNVRGTLGQIAFRIDDGDLFFNSNAGTAVMRFRSGQSNQVWQLRAYGTAGAVGPETGSFSIRDVTGGGNDPFYIIPGAANRLMSLDGTVVRIGQASGSSSPVNGTLNILGVDNAGPQIQLRAESTGGEFNLYEETGGLIAQIEANGNAGGELNLYDDEGTRHAWLAPDGSSGGGGYLFLDGGSGSQLSTGDVVLEGNFNGTGSPRMFMDGQFNIDLRTDIDGNASVNIPGNAISAFESLAEVGGAHEAGLSGTSVTTSTASTIATRTLTCPVAGNVLAIATAQISLAPGQTLDMGFNDGSPGVSGAQNMDFEYPAGTGGSGTIFVPGTVHGVFTCTQGQALQMFLSGARAGGTGTITIGEYNISLIFFPTNYGVVDGNIAQVGALSAEEGSAPEANVDPAAEMAEALQQNQRRMQAELAAMRAEIEALRAQDDANAEGDEQE